MELQISAPLQTYVILPSLEAGPDDPEEHLCQLVSPAGDYLGSMTVADAKVLVTHLETPSLQPELYHWACQYNCFELSHDGDYITRLAPKLGPEGKTIWPDRASMLRINALLAQPSTPPTTATH